jgi:4-hydroxy-3-polyprenylbenzoate decarboxylase
MTAPAHRVVVGITGASGAVYARRILQMLVADKRVERVHLVVSEAGQRLLALELGIVSQDQRRLPELLVGGPAEKVECLPNRDVGAPIASGSYPFDAMVIVPCTTGTLAAVASGTSEDLIARAADVCLKERRRLVLCIRETPLNRIHLENMLRADAAGAIIMPTAPAFYFQPATLEDLVTQFACRVLELLGLPQPEQYRWSGGRGRETRS